MAADEPNDPNAQQEPRADDLSEDLARKYDPDRLLKMVSKRAGKGERLDHSVRSKYEKRFGVDLGHVRVYTGEFAEEFNRQRNSYAVTIGSTGMILMGNSPDRSMGSASGKALLAHEITHVAQAKRAQNSRGFSFRMPFAQEHDDIEHEAESEEAQAHAEEQGVAASSSGTGGAAAQSKAAMNAKDKLEQAIEKVKERVLSLAADAVRNQLWRNSSSRRA
ncbi:MAG TPA: DUF4157 domain-containing protein [Kofleriaceae bacterium]|nr:DUF4157 domain-containing protein [Kofleriaceae bacterium]